MAKDKNIEIPVEVSESMASYIEALLFASDEPIPPKSLSEILTEFFSNGKSGEINPEFLTPDALRVVVGILNERYKERNQSFHIIEIAGGFQFATLPKFAKCLGILFKEKSKRRLSQSALETLAIIVFKQPISKPDIENIRGVNSDYVLSTLLEKDLVAIVGRADSVGRPLLYGTTQQFLKHFGLKDTKDLPKLKEIEEIMNSDEFKFEVKRLEESLRKSDENSEERDEPEIDPENIPADAQNIVVPDSSEKTGVDSPEVDTSGINVTEPSEAETSEIEVETSDENFIEDIVISDYDSETADIEIDDEENRTEIKDEPETNETDTSQEENIDNIESDFESSDNADDLKKKSSNIETASTDSNLGSLSFLFDDNEPEAGESFPPFIVSPEIIPPIGSDLFDEISAELIHNESFVGFQGDDIAGEEEKDDKDDDIPKEDFFVSGELEEIEDIGSDKQEPEAETIDESNRVEEIKSLSDEIELEYFPEIINTTDETSAPPEGESLSDFQVFPIEEPEFISELETSTDEENLEELNDLESIEEEILPIAIPNETLTEEHPLEEAEYTSELEASQEEESIEELETLESTEEEILPIAIPNETVTEEHPLEEAEYTSELENSAEEESIEELETLESTEEEILPKEKIKETVTAEHPLEEAEYTSELEASQEEESIEELETLESTEEEILPIAIPNETVTEEHPLEEAEYTSELENSAEEESLEELETLESTEEEILPIEMPEETVTAESRIEEPEKGSGETIIDLSQTGFVVTAEDEVTEPAEEPVEYEDEPQNDADVIHDYSGYELESSPIMTFRNLNYDEFISDGEKDLTPALPVRDTIEPDFIYKKRRWNYNTVVFQKIKHLPVVAEELNEITELSPTIKDEENIDVEQVLNTEENIDNSIIADNKEEENEVLSIAPWFDAEKFSGLVRFVFSDRDLDQEETLFEGIKFAAPLLIESDVEKEIDIEDSFEITPEIGSGIIQKIDLLLEKELFVPQKAEFDEILSGKYLDVIVKKDKSFAEIESFLTKDKYLDFSDKKNEIYTKLNTIYTGKPADDSVKVDAESGRRRTSPAKNFVDKWKLMLGKVLKMIKKFFTGRL